MTLLDTFSKSRWCLRVARSWNAARRWWISQTIIPELQQLHARQAELHKHSSVIRSASRPAAPTPRQSDRPSGSNARSFSSHTYARPMSAPTRHRAPCFGSPIVALQRTISRKFGLVVQDRAQLMHRLNAMQERQIQDQDRTAV